VQLAHVREGGAQALFYDFLPSDLIQLGASEPVTLVLTAIALLSLARVGTSNGRTAASDVRASTPAVARPDAATQHRAISTERAA